MSDNEELGPWLPSKRAYLAYVVYIGTTGVTVCAAAILFVLFLYTEWRNPRWTEVVFRHFPVTVGLPIAAVIAFNVIAIFRTFEGKIKVTILGVTFEGASGLIIMWIACFMAISVAIRMLW